MVRFEPLFDILGYGKVLDIAGATLQIDNQRPLEAKAGEDADSITFLTHLPKGPFVAEATFTDLNGEPIVGAYYLHIERIQ